MTLVLHKKKIVDSYGEKESKQAKKEIILLSTKKKTIHLIFFQKWIKYKYIFTIFTL